MVSAAVQLPEVIVFAVDTDGIATQSLGISHQGARRTHLAAPITNTERMSHVATRTLVFLGCLTLCGALCVSHMSTQKLRPACRVVCAASDGGCAWEGMLEAITFTTCDYVPPRSWAGMCCSVSASQNLSWHMSTPPDAEDWNY